MPYKDPAKDRERMRKYRQTEKGRIANQATAIRYRQSEKGKATNRRRYWRDPEYHRMKALGRFHRCEIAILKAVRERDKTCKRCSSTLNLTFDHIIPVSKGGKATIENLQILCFPCNSSKGATILAF